MKKIAFADVPDSDRGFRVAQTALPTGTAVKMKLETSLATFSSKAGDPFSARVTEPVGNGRQDRDSHRRYRRGPGHETDEPRRIAGKPTIAIFPENLILPNGDRLHAERTLVDTNAATAPTSTPKASSKAPDMTAKISPKSAWAPAAEC